jgi:hypothetical protein
MKKYTIIYTDNEEVDVAADYISTSTPGILAFYKDSEIVYWLSIHNVFCVTLNNE